MHDHTELAVRYAADDALRWWHVCVGAADGGAEVAVVGDEVVGGIEAEPPEMRHERLNPGVGGVRCGAVVVFAAAIEVTGDIAGGNSDVAKQGDHGVGEVLADAFAADDG